MREDVHVPKHDQALSELLQGLQGEVQGEEGMTYEEAVATIPPGRYRHFKGNEYVLMAVVDKIYWYDGALEVQVKGEEHLKSKELEEMNG